ncbi:MAG: RDD family protein [Bacteriovoracaceae bacterium]|nr:RDD family protein [Bacteriovoracaceae bacterium]
MKKNNVVKLVDFINAQKIPSTSDVEELDAFPLSKEKIILRRMFAFLCDFVCILTLKNMLYFSYAMFVANFLLPLTSAQKSTMIKMGNGWEVAIFTVVFFSYFLYCNFSLGGRSLGSHLMKLNVIDEKYPFDSEQEVWQPSFMQALKRTLAYMACYMSFGTFFFLSLLHEEKKGIPDFFSATRVVSDEWLKGFQACKRVDQEQVRININSLEKAA